MPAPTTFKKISELDELAVAPASDDVVPINDTSATETKKVTIANLAAGVVAAGSDSAQAITGRVNAEGTSPSLARADHTHQIAPATVSVSSPTHTLLATTGVLLVDTTASAIDVQLPAPGTVSGLLPILIIDVANNFGANKLDLLQAGAEEIDGIASTKGLETSGGRWLLWTDGVDWFTFECPPITYGPPVDVTKAAAAHGTSEEFARADHKHDIATAAPVAVGRAAAEGSSSSLARADHVHDTPVAIGEETGSFSLLATDDYIRITSAGAVTVTLPSPATAGARRWRILLSHNTPGDVTLDRAGAETIQGVAADYVLEGAWSRYELVCDGTNWWLF
jgi:hypothetical protein